ncbi:SDR family NAD(P)-dependent oxidoreductase [Solicola gregarius]|uniref:SDR family oxidoreductase n=1 Tax=Solicola gregarius TaxID=2908642 RepID=A0AA46YKY7_9ACTN|nr:SDR family NAD(P)-dependent oxidoreductase [Solicola gregarius]UYM06300.1 SDR family oxidoreductase [Solicola gregarius]
MNRFTGQVVLVTGGGRGLGAEMARRFASEGATVVIGEIDGAGGTRVADELTSRFGSAASADRINVASSTSASDWVDGVIGRYGRVDVLVNNAGIIRDGRVANITDDAWRDVVDVSLSGAFYLARAVLPHMFDRGYGRILSLSSMSWRGNFGQANYAAAKAGVVGLARTIALEGAHNGVTSNVIAPGLVETPMLASMDPAARAKLTAKIPTRTTGSPADIAAAAAYLCSPEARYVTGVVLDVDGGIGIGSSMR